jgi:hypothetical protein
MKLIEECATKKKKLACDVLRNGMEVRRGQELE